MLRVEVFQNLCEILLQNYFAALSLPEKKRIFKKKNNTKRERKADSKFSWPNSSEVKFAISLCSNKRSKKTRYSSVQLLLGQKNSSSKKLARLLKHLPGGVPWPRGDLKKRTQQLQLLQPAAQGGCGARAVLRQKDQPYSVGPQEDSPRWTGKMPYLAGKTLFCDDKRAFS